MARSGFFQYFYCTIIGMRFEARNIAHNQRKSFSALRYQKNLIALMPENQ